MSSHHFDRRSKGEVCDNVCGQVSKDNADVQKICWLVRHAFKNDSNQVAGGTDVPFFIFTRVFYTFLNITIILVLRYSSLVSVVHENHKKY